MDLDKINVRPYGEGALPALVFGLEISYAKNEEAILHLEGYIVSDDKKLVGQKGYCMQEGLYCELAARELLGRREAPTKQSWRAALLIPMSYSDLEYLEKRRMENDRGDLCITLRLDVTLAEIQASISPVLAVTPNTIGLTVEEISVAPTVKTRYSPLIYVQTVISPWALGQPRLLTGEGTTPRLIAFRLANYNCEVKITSTDWINDFAPKLGLGEYFIVHIPHHEKRIMDAWKYVESAEECFREWNSKGVYANCREIGTVLDKTMQEMLGGSTFMYKEKWGRTFALFKHLSSVDLHLEDFKRSQGYLGDEVRITRADAENLLLMTKLLVRYADEVLEGK